MQTAVRQRQARFERSSGVRRCRRRGRRRCPRRRRCGGNECRPVCRRGVMAGTLVLMPVAILGGAVGMAKIKRRRKEKAIQAAMGGCLHERGYEVAGWQRAPKILASRKAAD